MARVTLDRMQSVETIEELRRFVSRSLEAITGQFNGRVDFGDNVRSSTVTVLLRNEPTSVPHSLGRVPQGYIVIGQNAVGTVFRPSSALFPWTETQLFLQSSTVAEYTLLII